MRRLASDTLAVLLSPAPSSCPEGDHSRGTRRGYEEDRASDGRDEQGDQVVALRRRQGAGGHRQADVDGRGELLGRQQKDDAIAMMKDSIAKVTALEQAVNAPMPDSRP